MLKNKWAILVAISLSFGVLSGCGTLDSFFGYNPESGEYKPGESPSGTVGSVGGLLAPWLPTALSLVGWMYSAIRGKKYYQAGRSLIPALDLVLGKLDKGESIDRKEVVGLLEEWKRRLSVDKQIKDLRGK